MRKKLKTLKALHDECWKLQSEYVRRKNANFQGLAPCYTCGKLYHWKLLQAGHFVHNSYDFDIECNIRPQCTNCNKWNHGRPLEYYLHLVRELGRKIADKARTRKHWNAYKRPELMALIAKYKKLISGLA